MPWKEACAMDEKYLFVRDYQAGRDSMSELCRRYGVSRPTGYLWAERYAKQGVEGLLERSRAARKHPNALPAEMVEAIVELRGRYGFGPRKIRKKLLERHPGQKPPARSTIAAVLQRHGLSGKRIRRPRVHSYPHTLVEPSAPNQVWGVDFKGWFKTGDGQRCDPLTITDLFSRYLICAQVVTHTGGRCVQLVFEDCFRRYGLPEKIRSDNGPPFAGRGAGGLSRLSLWWLRLGIGVERIRPGRPQQNGCHERFHRTLKERTASPPAANLPAQQRCFEAFKTMYNEQRPHESLADRYPADLYERSSRRYPTGLSPIEYPSELSTRRVGKYGEIYWRQHKLFLSELLRREKVALRPIDGRYCEVLYGPAPLALLDTLRGRLIRRPQRIHKILKELKQTGAKRSQVE